MTCNSSGCSASVDNGSGRTISASLSSGTLALNNQWIDSSVAPNGATSTTNLATGQTQTDLSTAQGQQSAALSNALAFQNSSQKDAIVQQSLTDTHANATVGYGTFGNVTADKTQYTGNSNASAGGSAVQTGGSAVGIGGN
jgi:hypothetical protein